MRRSHTINTFEIITLGCRLNSYESQLIEGHLADLGAQDTIVINTCAVTNESVRQCKQTVRKMKRHHPTKKIILTGCAAHIHTQNFAHMPEVSAIVDNTQKLEKKAWASVLGLPQPQLKNISLAHPQAYPQAKTKRVRGFVEIQNGCDHRCTFCIIPYGRGPSRSRSPFEITAQIQEMVKVGYKEVTLTGVDLTSYQFEGILLGKLVETILEQVPHLPRLRLSSLDVAEIDPQLFELLATHPRLMPHVHLSLQAGDNMILKRMKRRHNHQQAVDFCTQLRARRPNITFGADFIAGFPTETETMFANTRRLIEACDLIWLHVFPFSPRAGTPAARMPQVDPSISKERAAQLRALGQQQKEHYFQTQMGQTLPILMENTQLGRSEAFAPIQVDQPLEIGQILSLQVTNFHAERLIGAF